MNTGAGRPAETAAGATGDAAKGQGLALTLGGLGTIAELGGVPVAWHISTRSADNGGSCVEAGPLADGSGRVAVRHSHFPEGVAILYSKAEWQAFVGGVKGGEFDFFG